jgi:hypothetical protein
MDRIRQLLSLGSGAKKWQNPGFLFRGFLGDIISIPEKLTKFANNSGKTRDFRAITVKMALTVTFLTSDVHLRPLALCLFRFSD